MLLYTYSNLSAFCFDDFVFCFFLFYKWKYIFNLHFTSQFVPLACFFILIFMFKMFYFMLPFNIQNNFYDCVSSNIAD